MIEINLFALSGLLIALSSGIMATVMFFAHANKLQVLWGIFCVSVCIWGIGGYFIGMSSDPSNALFWWRITHIGIAFIPALFLHFVITFLDIKKLRMLYLVYTVAGILAFLALFTDLIISNVRLVFDEFYYDSPPGVLYPLFTVYFFGLSIYSHWLLFKAYRNHEHGADECRERSQVRYFFMATIIGFLGGGLSFLPVYGIDVYPVTNFAVTVYPIIMGYAILRHKLFDIRIATAQGLVLLLWIFAGARIVVSNSLQSLLINLFFFFAFFILGIFLVRSINQEINARKKNEHLAHKLQKANKRLKRVDEMKSEFVSIASHQLRSPLTSIRGYSSMLLEGSFGKIPKKAKKALERISLSSAFMGRMVEDYLNVSRIEAGKLEYTMSNFNIIDTVSNVVDMFRPKARQAGLSFRFQKKTSRPLQVHADKGKVRQIVQNMIDNAIKYTPEGSITVTAKTENGHVIIAVKDTGIGMSQETVKALFKKFYRASNANNVNVNGTGLGLYVAYTMANDMGGALRATSDGEGEGSTFTFTLPLVKTRGK